MLHTEELKVKKNNRYNTVEAGRGKKSFKGKLKQDEFIFKWGKGEGRRYLLGYL